MDFCAFYPVSICKTKVFDLLAKVIKEHGVKIFEQERNIRTNEFAVKIQGRHYKLIELELPLDVQYEAFKFENDKIVSVNMLTLDVEAVLIVAEKKTEVSEIPKAEQKKSQI